MPGLGGSLAGHVFDEAVAFAVPRAFGDHKKGLADLAVGRGQVEELLVGVGQGELGHAQPSVRVADANRYLFITDKYVLTGLWPVVEDFGII